MRIEDWLNKLNEIVESAKQKGLNDIDYLQVSSKLSITPNYARELLKIYAYRYGMKYERGRLILEEVEEGS